MSLVWLDYIVFSSSTCLRGKSMLFLISSSHNDVRCNIITRNGSSLWAPLIRPIHTASIFSITYSLITKQKILLFAFHQADFYFLHFIHFKTYYIKNNIVFHLFSLLTSGLLFCTEVTARDVVGEIQINKDSCWDAGFVD